MADKNNTISLCVDKVLEYVGASEQIRRNQVEKGLVDEAVWNITLPFIYNANVRRHNFGSWCEGTTTKGLNSDMDKLFYVEDLPAVEEIPDGFEDGYLIINDGTTRQGYVKLQSVYNGIPAFNSATPKTETDQFERVCLRTIYRPAKYVSTMSSTKSKRTGPAVTLYGPNVRPEIDQVYSFRCYSIPSFTREWIHRPRKYDWPSKQLLDEMSNYGCFLVPKGHPSSQTEHIEWRISFSFQERELMFSLNSTQHKCYILLKMIKQYLVSKMTTKSISSYHLKTSLFYTIENNPAHIWIPDNLVYCTELCLKQLLDWLNYKNCPNFFVPEENMFDRLSSDVMKMTAKYIRDMLDSGGQYLMLLTCDKFGELLQESLSGKVLSNLSRDAIEFDLNSRLDVLECSIFWANRIVTLSNRNCASETLCALQSVLEQIRSIEERLVSEKVFKETKKGVNLILPIIHLHIAKTIAAIILTVTDADKKHELMQNFDHHIEQANGYDTMSQSLIKASLLFKENKLEECERILDDCKTSLNDFVLTVCSCKNTHSDDEFKNLIEKAEPASNSLLDLHRKYVTPCLMFPPSQADLVPTPLQYEMYRSVGANTGTVHPEGHHWYGAIVIDAKFYMFFLQYLVYLKLDKHLHAAVTIIKFYLSLSRASIVTNIGHMETVLNLFGWILKHKNDKGLAAQWFYKSWKIKPDHNAAKWHMLVMMYEQYIQRSKT